MVVEFWAAWCKPCVYLAPAIDEIAHEYNGKVRVGKLDVDQNQAIAMRYGINSIPTILIFSQGRVVQRIVGPQRKYDITRHLEYLLVNSQQF